MRHGPSSMPDSVSFLPLAPARCIGPYEAIEVAPTTTIQGETVKNGPFVQGGGEGRIFLNSYAASIRAYLPFCKKIRCHVKAKPLHSFLNGLHAFLFGILLHFFCKDKRHRHKLLCGRKTFVHTHFRQSQGPCLIVSQLRQFFFEPGFVRLPALQLLIKQLSSGGGRYVLEDRTCSLAMPSWLKNVWP